MTIGRFELISHAFRPTFAPDSPTANLHGFKIFAPFAPFAQFARFAPLI